MASTYSTLKVELIGTGEQTGTWGTTTNDNLSVALGEAITGSADVAFSSADVTVTLTNTNAAQTARNLRLNLTGTSGGARNLILGSGCQIEKLYLINNGLADAVTVKNTSGTGIAVAAGKTMFVYNNGTNVVDAYLNMFPTAFEMYQTDIRAVFGGTPPARSSSWNENGNRIVEGDYLPPYCCSVLSFRPNVASKRWHGKNFYGGLVEADQVNGSLQSSIQTPLGAWAVAMLNRYGQAGASSFQWVVLSDPDHTLPLLETVGDPGIDTPSALSVDSYHVGSFVRTQKRRDFFRGN